MEITLEIHHETERAYLVSETGNEDDAVWIPKSQIEISDPVEVGEAVEITMPEWLAKERGFI
jgi:hypothetical protein